jgi:signal transduction histidine kinase
MIKIDQILNYGSENELDINTIRLIRQMNGLSLFFTMVALSVGLICLLFLANARGTLVLGLVQIPAAFLYFATFVLTGFKKLAISRKLILYTFEWHLFLVTMLTYSKMSPILAVIVIYPLLAALVEESIFLHLSMGMLQLTIIAVLHFVFPNVEASVLQFANIPDNITYFLFLMGLVYFPFMASVIMKIIFMENLRARGKQKEMQVKETMYTENKKYLDNINEGLMLINRSLIVSDQYSNFTLVLFGDKNIAGLNFIDIIFPDPIIQKVEREELARYIDILFTNKTASTMMLKDIDPLKDKLIKIRGSGEDAKERDVSMTFQRIFKSKNVVENLMVLFEDKTNIIKKDLELKTERFVKEREIEIVSAILKQGPQVFHEFIKDAASAIAEIKSSIDIIHDDEILIQLLRALHSVKSIARAMELNYMAEILHNGEDIITGVRLKRVTNVTEIRKNLLAYADIAASELTRIEQLMDKIILFRRFDMLPQNDKMKILLDNFIKTLDEMVASISRNLQKDIEFKAVNELDEFPYLNKLKSSIIHLVRNSIDHGIEDIFERLSQNKNQRGIIGFKMSKDENNYYIEVSDDGGNIDFEMIRKKAIEKNILLPGDGDIEREQLLNLLFLPEFSSKDRVTDISGRGLGLNIVKSEVGKLNGRIKVSLTEHKETKFTLIIPIVSALQPKNEIQEQSESILRETVGIL